MKSIRLTIATVCIVLAGIIAGCSTPESRFMDIAQKEPYNFTKDQALAGFAWALRYKYMTDKDGKPEINYSAIKIKEVIDVVSKMETDVYTITDGSNAEWEKLIKVVGLNDYLTRKKKVYKIVKNNLQLYYLYAKFHTFIGSGFSYGWEDGPKAKFSVKMILPSDEEKKKMEFSYPLIEEAKKSGKLDLIQRFIGWSDEKLAEKISDPEDPKEANKFVWRGDKQGVEILTWRLNGHDEKPKDNAGDYIEMWRITYETDNTTGMSYIKRESKPAVMVFMTNHASGINVFVIDIDKEDAEYGFGMPDVVDIMTSVSSGKDLYFKDNIMKMIFPSKKEKRSQPEKEINLEIARSGGAPPPIWEISEDPAGFKVPFIYASPTRDNYTVDFVFDDSKKESSHHGNSKKIKYVVKKWHDPSNPYLSARGDTVEYYKPKPPFDGEDILEAKVLFGDNGKKITVTKKGQVSVIGFITPGDTMFIGVLPDIIAYTDGNARWEIAARNNDNHIYDSRRKIPLLKKAEMEIF